MSVSSVEITEPIVINGVDVFSVLSSTMLSIVCEVLSSYICTTVILSVSGSRVEGVSLLSSMLEISVTGRIKSTLFSMCIVVGAMSVTSSTNVTDSVLNSVDGSGSFVVVVVVVLEVILVNGTVVLRWIASGVLVDNVCWMYAGFHDGTVVLGALVVRLDNGLSMMMSCNVN